MVYLVMNCIMIAFIIFIFISIILSLSLIKKSVEHNYLYSENNNDNGLNN